MLFNPNESLAPRAQAIAREFTNLIQPLIVQWVRERHSTIELEHLLVGEVELALADLRLRKIYGLKEAEPRDA